MTAPISIALPVLRIGLFVFMMFWAISKLLAPAGAQGIFQGFYGLSLGLSPIIFVGIVQIVILVAFVLGLFRTVTYGLVALMNLLTLLVAAKPIIFAFTEGGNLLFAASIPVLSASVALFLLRDQDSFLTVKLPAKSAA
ncbi:hypothetical protein ACMU_04310 [Actibacterium mucosum KCTC 23349]|uniref:DoxX family protein n=1 Tax=Actibacterium mucosum KCTC 23349 TaxID=1454373 RepID=A0A037ZF17_9RHOB|nr:hypothetical protein [Actibacterium mucosum]KAJ54126.1 hypothetical protein ACMU_04310 [Actibacterium mucosum KCTC 23349]